MAMMLKEVKNKLRVLHHYGFDVSTGDIQAGIPDSTSHCALANGLRSAGCGDPSVCSPRVSFSKGPWRYRGVMDSAALWSDWTFDAHGTLEPKRIVIQVIAARPRRTLGSRASRGLPPKGPHKPKGARVCSPTYRRYHELKAMNL
jgi:hypothetical protein